jgi:hypothetical protein
MERGNFSAAAGFGMAKDRQVRRENPVHALTEIRVLDIFAAAH